MVRAPRGLGLSQSNSVVCDFQLGYLLVKVLNIWSEFPWCERHWFRVVRLLYWCIRWTLPPPATVSTEPDSIFDANDFGAAREWVVHGNLRKSELSRT